jgi:hypothetical protein
MQGLVVGIEGEWMVSGGVSGVRCRPSKALWTQWDGCMWGLWWGGGSGLGMTRGEAVEALEVVVVVVGDEASVVALLKVPEMRWDELDSPVSSLPISLPSPSSHSTSLLTL